MNADETRERILQAADQLFGEFGFDIATTRDIAERSGVNKALIHYHFGSKDDLLEAVLDRYYTELAKALEVTLGRRRTLLEQAEALVDAYTDYLAEHRAFARIVQREVASGRHVERVVQRTLPAFQLGLAWFGASFKHAPKDFDAVQVLTTVYGMVVIWFHHGEVVRALTGRDPFAPAALAARKRHLRKVVGLLLSEIDPKE